MNDDDDNDDAWVVALPLPLLRLVEAALVWRDADRDFIDYPEDGGVLAAFEDAEDDLRVAVNAFDVTYTNPRAELAPGRDADDETFN